MTVDRIKEAMTRDLKPVRPLPSTAWLVAALLAVCAAAAIGGASTAGLYGWRRLNAAALAAIFVPLVGQAALLAEAAAASMIPGAKRPAHPAVLAGAACLLMVAIFAAVFHDYRTDGFVPQGVRCLRAGLMWAVPAAAGVWLVLRRGFAVDGRAAGVAMGALAGLAGLAMLELHCPNFRLAHVAVWHTGAAVVAAAAGWAVGARRSTSSARTSAPRS